MTADPAADYVLRVDKQVGPTSHDVVAAARRALKTRRVGHTGTLDPFASGLLLLCINRATRIAEYLTGLDKVYRATASLAAFTTTDDHTGEIVERSESWHTLDRELIATTMRALTGPQQQLPPMFSAKKIAGERLHRLARRGLEVERTLVPVVIHRFELVSVDLPQIEFEVECSSGTYVRVLARDLGRALGTGGHLTALRRTRVGGIAVEGAVPSDRLEETERVAAAAISTLDALAHLPHVQVDEAEARSLRYGQAINTTLPDGGPVVVRRSDELIAIAQAAGTRLKPSKVWANE